MEVTNSILENHQQNKNVKKYRFITEKSKDFDLEFIDIAEKALNRDLAIYNINKILYNIKISQDVELGIFEFTLVYVINNNITMSLLPAIYNDKLHDIIININGDPAINNKILKGEILNEKINPQLVAFLPSHKMHTKNWEKLIEKKKFKEYKENNLVATDLYKCYKCGSSKCKISQMQTRSADEPVTTYIVCLVCYNTFKKN